MVHPQPEVAARWCGALAARLPDAQVRPWDAGCEQADFAVAWNPPDAFFERTRIDAALFSAGAGVDRLLLHPGLPRSLPVVRVEDAGMGAQMAEYCCHEVLRVFRLAPQYESQQRERVWRELDASPAIEVAQVEQRCRDEGECLLAAGVLRCPDAVTMPALRTAIAAARRYGLLAGDAAAGDRRAIFTQRVERSLRDLERLPPALSLHD